MKTPSPSTRQWLASLPLLTALLLISYAADLADRLPTWAGVLLGVSFSVVSVQWGRVAEHAKRPTENPRP